jgi:hypothetical protein
LARPVCWRFASAVPALRALPATALTPLSHMLSKGFIFVHGFATASSSQGCSILNGHDYLEHHPYVVALHRFDCPRIRHDILPAENLPSLGLGKPAWRTICCNAA